MRMVAGAWNTSPPDGGKIRTSNESAGLPPNCAKPSQTAIQQNRTKTEKVFILIWTV
jgi:hypothetical protein